MNELRFRQVHLDYHMAGDLPALADDFDAPAFAATLAAARVDSVTCFARDHYGYLYYDSARFPERRHPRLARPNLLAEQIAACHAVGIRVPVYITVQWDHYTADRHPEWCVLTPHGKIAGTPPHEPGFYRFLCLNSPYRDWLKAHTAEVLDSVPVDGIFFDILWVIDCSCRHCRESLRQRGLDPADPAVRLAFAHTLMAEFTRDMSAFVRQRQPDCAIYYNSGGIRPGYHGHTDAFTHLEFDVLPSAWPGGYVSFPIRARFDRTLGRQCMGMTGKFHRGWGDVHTLKNQAALEYECFQLLALNCRCSIGDQLHPRGRLEPHTYALVGSVYAQVEAKEPWCRDASPVTEIAVISVEEFGASRNSMVGAVRLLSELGHQFDIVDSAGDFAACRVLILPDRIPVGSALHLRLAQFLAGGGRLLASFESGLTPAGDRFALAELGVELLGPGPLAPDGRPARGRIFPHASFALDALTDYCEVDFAEYVRPRPALAGGLPEIEHAMYTMGVQVAPVAAAEVLADTILPYYYRTAAHFCSHQQAPSSGQVGTPAVVRHGSCAYLAHAVFDLYADYAPRWIRQLVANTLAGLLPEPLLRVSGPSALEAMINAQPEQRRWVVHLLYYVPERRANKMEIVEDVLPVDNVGLSVRDDLGFTAARLVPQGTPLPLRRQAGRLELTVPRLHGHQMVELSWPAP